MKLNKIHHVAVICSDYEQSKYFYTEVLGLKIVSENYREERHSWKADCWLGNTYVVELFSFPNPPARPSYPEAAGLRHLAFEIGSCFMLLLSSSLTAAERSSTSKARWRRPAASG